MNQSEMPSDRPYPISQMRRRALRLLVTQKKRCFLCGKKARPEDVNIHHFIPVSRGGCKASLINQTATHRHCNTAKADKEPTLREWIRYIIVTQRKFRMDFGAIDLWQHFPNLADLGPARTKPLQK